MGLTIGTCGDCGRRVHLDTDCCGYPIGYIDPQGLAWQTREERDRAVGGGRCIDAWVAWQRHGGMLAPEPDYGLILTLTSVLDEHRDDALRELTDGIELYSMPFMVAARAARAMLN